MKRQNKFQIWLKQLRCKHSYYSNLIFCASPNTHKDIITCNKCDKTKTLFNGTRTEWYNYRGIDI